MLNVSHPNTALSWYIPTHVEIIINEVNNNAVLIFKMLFIKLLLLNPYNSDTLSRNSPCLLNVPQFQNLLSVHSCSTVFLQREYSYHK